MKCQIQWIDTETGKPTPDDNDAVAMAHAHKALWSLPCGGIGNRVIGYSQEIHQSFPICAHHLARMKPEWNGWSVTPLETEGKERSQ
jgi:hypothetical protein